MFRHVLAPLLFGLALFTWVLTTVAAESSKRRQAAILARVLSYELTLDERAGDAVGVAVIYKRGDPSSERNANDWLDALQELSAVKIKNKRFFALKIAYAPNDVHLVVDSGGVDVLLLADGLGAEAEAIARIARSKHVLTTSNDVSHVARDVTVCVVEEAEKLKVVINLNTAKQEGIRFSSSLLKVAKLVR